MSPKQVQNLLNELCGGLGFCLPPIVQTQPMNDPPDEVDSFTDAVIRAEGLDPWRDIPLRLRRDVRARVAKHFIRAEGDAVDDQR